VIRNAQIFVQGEVRNNSFIGNQIGIEGQALGNSTAGVLILCDSHNNYFAENIIQSNENYGIWLQASAGLANTFTKNLIFDNVNSPQFYNLVPLGPSQPVVNTPIDVDGGKKAIITITTLLDPPSAAVEVYGGPQGSMNKYLGIANYNSLENNFYFDFASSDIDEGYMINALVIDESGATSPLSWGYVGP
ncbi:hypothetical protein KKA47_01095, partial [bacterium]|nr:hypothetical protein [bacterium]